MAHATIRLGIAAVVMTLTGCAGPSPPPSSAPPSIAADAPLRGPIAAVAATISDEQFLDQAASGGATVTALGRLARERAQDPAVRAFAARMIIDHHRLNTRLIRLARRLNLEAAAAPAAPGPLAALQGSDFDRQYIADQIRAHQDLIGLFEAEAQQGRNPQLRRVARDWLRLLRNHLRSAEDIAHRIRQ